MEAQLRPPSDGGALPLRDDETLSCTEINKHVEITRRSGKRHSPLGVIRSQIREFCHQSLEFELLCSAVLHPDRSILQTVLAQWDDQFLGRQKQRISTELVGLS